jgi:hypothetical protein
MYGAYQLDKTQRNIGLLCAALKAMSYIVCKYFLCNKFARLAPVDLLYNVC